MASRKFQRPCQQLFYHMNRDTTRVSRASSSLSSSSSPSFSSSSSSSSSRYGQIRQHVRHQGKNRNDCSLRAFAQQPRHLSVASQAYQRDILLPGGIFQSHIPEVHIPDNIPFHQLIFDACDTFKDKPALSDVLTGKTYTYNQLKENTIRVASALTRKGYRKGDVILMFSGNQIDYTVLMLAASCLGLWFCAANPVFIADELARQISHSGSRAVFVTEDLIPIAEKALKSEALSGSLKDIDRFVFGKCDGWQPFENLIKDDDGKAFPDVAIDPKEDVFVLPYSSGTTGFPKGVLLTHHNLVANVLQIDNSFSVQPDENLLGLLPLYHIYGMVFVQFEAVFKGAHLHVLPKFEPQTFMDCMKNSKITTAHLVPPIILFMAKHPLANKESVLHLRNVLSGAAPLGKELTDEFLEKFSHGVNLKQVYGLTETSPGTNLDAGFNVGSIGNLLCNTQAKIIDLETGENLGPNMEGEYCVRGPQVMKAYYKNPKATEDSIKDGWFHTGDIGYYSEQGLVYISDRLKELIKYKGSQVAPAELEALLIGHPDVLDACVIGVPDERAGELPKAFVVPRVSSEVSETDIVKYIEERVSPTKRLRGGVEFIDKIPRNASGKTLRKFLKS